jgi:hypothetical protein
MVFLVSSPTVEQPPPKRGRFRVMPLPEQEETPFAERVSGAIAGAGKAAGRAVVGAGKAAIEAATPRSEEFLKDVPEFQTVARQEIVKAGRNSERAKRFQAGNRAITFPTTLEGKIKAFREAFPEAKLTRDNFGNIVIDGVPGVERSLLNRRGASGQDLAEAMKDLVLFGPAVRFGGALGARALGGVGRVLGVGAGAGGASAVSDVAGGQVPDLGTATATGVLGAGIEGAVSAVGPLARLGRQFFRNRRFFKNGRVTPAGLKVLERNGIDPATVTPEAAERFLRETARGAPAQQAQRVAETQTLPEPVPVSRGELRTGTPTREEALLQRQAVQANFPAVQQQIARGQAGAEGAEVVQAGLAGQRRQMAAQASRQFGEARAKGAVVTREGVANLRGTITGELIEDGFDEGLSPQTFRIVRELEDTGMTLRAVDSVRKRLTRLRSGIPTPESVAAGRAVRALDRSLDEAMDQAMILGDKTAVNAFRQARATTAAMKARFKDNRIIRAMVEEDFQGNLVLDPQQAMNRLFNASSVGAKKGSRDAAKKIGEAFGRNSDEFNALRQEAFLRLLPNPNQPPTGFAEKLRVAMRDNTGLMRELFDPNELALFSQLARATGQKLPAAQRRGMVRRLFGALRLTAAATGEPLSVATLARSGIASLADQQAVRAAPTITRAPIAAGALLPLVAPELRERVEAARAVR